MNFKDFLDIDSDVFINADEFAELVNLNGQDIKAVVTFNTANFGGSDPATNGVHSKKHTAPVIGDFCTLHFKLDDYDGDLPLYSEFIRLNGVRYEVTDSQELSGVARLVLKTDRMTAPPALPRFNLGGL